MGVQAAEKVAAIELFVRESGLPGKVGVRWKAPEVVIDGPPETDNERYMLLVVTKNEGEVARAVVPVAVGKASFELEAGSYTIFATIVWSIGAGENPAAELLKFCQYMTSRTKIVVVGAHWPGLLKLNQQIRLISGQRPGDLSSAELAYRGDLEWQRWNLLESEKVFGLLEGISPGIDRSRTEARLDFTVSL